MSEVRDKQNITEQMDRAQHPSKYLIACNGTNVIEMQGYKVEDFISCWIYFGSFFVAMFFLAWWTFTRLAKNNKV